ncbi:MAG TPA: ABC transporter permease [Bryobacteraceae bacterium]|nr:ABC transporter permease [Bryobacteraceae bacterium]
MNFRVAFRSLRRSPGFTAVAILTLTLGIGAVSAMFSVVNSVLLKPLAGVNTQRIVKVSERFANHSAYTRARTYREWRKLTEIFDESGVRQYCNPNLTGAGEPQQLTAPCVTASWFGVLRAQALLGRRFLPDEDQPGHAQVVVLDHGFWLRRFGGDPAVIGRAITLDQKPYTVVGVMPKDFLPLGKGSADLYLPWVLAANELTGVEMIARLRSGVTIDQARTALAVVLTRLAQDSPEDYKSVTAEVQPWLESIVGPSRELLRLLLAASALVLLVACVNVANLFLARGAAKRREMEIRAFLGANPRQLLAPAVAESAIVACLGGSLGLLAAWGIARVLSVRLTNFPRSEEIGVDWYVVMAALLVSILTVFICGLAPAMLRTRVRPGALVTAEVALTFVLLICSGLLMRSFAAMRQVDLGYNPSGVILGFISQPEDPRDSRVESIALWRRVREKIAALPDVAAIATTTGTPTGGLVASFQIVREGEDVERATAPDKPGASTVIATGDYFRVVGIRLLQGRTFDDHDSTSAPPVVIVSQSVADRYFGGHALGQRILLPRFNFNVTTVDATALHEIVGVVADVKQSSIQESGRMSLYLPESQNAVRYTHVIARVHDGDPMRLEHSLRRAIFDEAPTVAVAPMLTLETGGAYLTRAPLRAMWLLGVFAGLALLLAAVGVHGVVAYATTQRSREMGIRMALGARPAQLFGLVTRQALNLTLAGAFIGSLGAYGASRLLESLMFGVGRTDPTTYAAAIIILTAIAAVASFTPALRAARTDPSITLRSE